MISFQQQIWITLVTGYFFIGLGLAYFRKPPKDSVIQKIIPGSVTERQRLLIHHGYYAGWVFLWPLAILRPLFKLPKNR